MQIVYCDTCGKRITDATQAHQDGDRWICVTCRPATSAAAPVEDDPERARSTVMVERLNGSPATSSQARRRTLPTGGPRGGVGPQPPQVKSPVALYAAAGVGVLLLGVVGLALMSGKSAPATVTSTSANGSSGGTGANPSPAPAHSSSSGQALTPAPAVPSTPNPSPAPSPATPVPPAPVPATPNPSPAPPPVPDPVRPSANKEGEARAKFTPLKAEFDRAKSANDLKTMARVAGDMGMISRDYDGTATATEALAVIKLFNEIKAADRIREASMEFRKAKGAAKEYNDDVAEAIANLRKIAKEMNGTTAAAEAETDIKNYLEGEAGRHWNRAKGKTTGDTPEAAAACDLAAKVAREFAGTDAAKEADKALADEEKRLLETRGTSAFLVLQSGLWHARDPRTVRDIVNQAHSLLDSGEGDEALNGLIERALKVLEDFTTPAARTKPAFGWQNAAAIKKDFYAIDGSKGDLIKEADNKGAIKFTSAGPAVRVMVALMHTEEDSVLKLNYKVQGIKNLTLRFVSTTYRQTFEYKVPNLKNDAAEALALPLATVKKDKASLHNAYVSILEIRGEKAKADDAAAAILLYSGDLTSGRAK